jgi:metal-dependent amidase/aminoacylase/carboxypeptidase family protein
MANPVERIRRYHPELQALRRDLHAHPELAFEESRTSALVAEKLGGWGIEVHRGLARTGVVGVIHGKNAGGKAIGLRADMDCLPVQEASDLAYKSRTPGRMHACGHDGHTTMLLGAARYLAVDPVVAAAQIISALQTVASRNVNPLDAAVVSVCSMQTSQVGAFNIIPDSVTLAGTVRTFRAQTRDLAERRVKEIVTKIAEGFGASAEIDYRRGYPATVNSPREAEFAARVGRRIFGAENVITEHEPTMGGEDFAYMLLERPGAYVFLGQGGMEHGCLLHNSRYDFNDEVIPLGAGYLAALVEEALPL